ncbi:MAG: hypothetical protein H0X43_12390 [Nitrosospira sp.]|nr:hypothetical protein [Nitrosospira sp.]
MREEIPAPVLMVAATLLFATMGMFVASVDYSTGEIVFYRGVVGTAIVILLTQWRGKTLRTSLPWMHLGRRWMRASPGRLA